MRKTLLITACCLPFMAQSAQYGSYISGGIGTEERAMFKVEKAQYNVEVKAALESGHYLSNVTVTFLQDGKSVLQGITDGPFFFAKLHPGYYRVDAIYNDQELTREITIPESGMREVLFRFKGEEAIIDEDPAALPETTVPEDARIVPPAKGHHQVKDPNVGDGIYYKGYVK